MEWSTACPDWERRIVAGESLIPCAPLFPSEAEAALAVFKSLRVTDLPGKPTFGECAREWVFDFVRAVFGAYDAETGKRLIEEFLLLISKKNTKSTLAAGIMLTAIIRNWRPENELNILAPTLEVANNCYGPAAGMVRADPVLTDLFHLQDNLRRITHRTTDAMLKVVAADSDTVGGKKTAFVLIDELHLFGKKNGAEAMLMEATGGLVSRPEGFVISLTTQSDEPPSGVFKAKLDYFRDVRDGKVTDRKKLGVLYDWPEKLLKEQAYMRPEFWHVTNPNLGLSVREDWIADKLAEAERGGQSTLRVFLAKHLNVEIGMRLRADRWPGADYWEAAAADFPLTLDELLARSEVVTMGADGGGLDDLLGVAVLGREKGTGRWLLWTWAACHSGVLDRRKAIASLLEDLARSGELLIADELGRDMEELTAIARKVVKSGKLPPKNAAGLDASGIGGVSVALQDGGVTEEQLVGVPQGWRLTGAIGTTERALADGSLKHGGQRLMAWCVSNAKVEPRGNAKLITKAASGVGKIDPLMASFNAVSLMNLNPRARGRASITLLD